MPFINSSSSLQSTVMDWQKRDIRKNTDFPIYKPRHPTSDLFDDIYPRTKLYRRSLSPSQIYSGTSRETKHKFLKTALCGLPGDKTLQIRWRPSSETPAFSLEFLQMYLTRKYGRVASIYQQAVNSCLVVFEDPQSAYVFSRDPEKGSPHGRLYARWWRPQPQDNAYFQVLKHVEKAGETKVWFNELMDRVDRASLCSHHRAFSRAMSARNKTYGPSTRSALAHADNIKDVFKVIQAEKKVEQAEPPKGGVKEVSEHDEFMNIVRKNRPTVVKFFATWCVPCVMIAPEVERLSWEYVNVTFISVDVDENEETADHCNITLLPTFQFFFNGRLVDEVKGNSAKVLEAKINQMLATVKGLAG